MAMESLISLQSSGQRSAGKPSAPRPIGIHQGYVLVVLDVNKGVTPTAVCWALTNVARNGDNVKILGIITHIANAMGFMMRVEQSSRISPTIMELQSEIAVKKEAIYTRIAYIKEWCQKAGVKMEVDVKAGNNPKVIAIDEAKSISAYHVVLDKHMKKDKKFFVDNLSCFVSRVRSSGGVEIIRTFAMSNKLPPMAPTTPKRSSQAAHQSKASTGSNASHRGGSSMSSTSFELGGESSDDYSGQESDPLSAPSTGESIDQPLDQETQLMARTSMELGVPKQSPNLYYLLRGPVHDVEIGYNMNNPIRKSDHGDYGFNMNNALRKPDHGNNGFNMNNPLRKSSHGDNGFNMNNPLCKPVHGDNVFNMNNPLRKPAVRKWLNEDVRISMSDLDQQGPPTPRTEFRFEQGPATPRGGQRIHHHQMGSSSWIGQLNVTPELGQISKMGRHNLTAQLRTQASFNTGRKHFRPGNISMDIHWPLMHWADCRAMKLRSRYVTGSTLSSSNSSMNNFRNVVRRKVSVSSGLNYGDMVDSD